MDIFYSINCNKFLSFHFSKLWIIRGNFFSVDQLGRSAFSIPYIDGSLSISRASRTFPQYLIFKPAMIMTAIILYSYWLNNNNLINKFKNTNISYKFKTFGILSAIFLAIHSIFLGIKFDIQIYKLMRRVILLLFIIFELIAQGILVYHLFKIRDELSKFINKRVLIFKAFLVSVLSLLLQLPSFVLKFFDSGMPLFKATTAPSTFKPL